MDMDIPVMENTWIWTSFNGKHMDMDIPAIENTWIWQHLANSKFFDFIHLLFVILVSLAGYPGWYYM